MIEWKGLERDKRKKKRDKEVERSVVARAGLAPGSLLQAAQPLGRECPQPSARPSSRARPVQGPAPLLAASKAG